MNDERELYNIIVQLGGHASTKAIVKEYCRQHHMMLQPLYLSIVKSILSDNGQNIIFDEKRGEWRAPQEDDPSKASLEVFKSRFEKDSGIPSTPVYEIYYAAAEKLWNLYSEQYDLRPRSQANAKNGKNRGVEFYKDGKHIIGISIGKTATIYVHDKDLRNRLDIDYEITPYGEYRHTYDTVDEVIAAMDGIEDVKGIIFDTNRTYDENSIWEMIQGRKVSAYGTMAEAVNDFRKGDYVFYYHKGYGIVAAGIIKSDKKEIKGDTEELYRDVELLTPEIDSIGENRYISYAELSELLNKSFYMARTAKVPYLSEEECKKVLECLEKKFAAETIGRVGGKKK